MKENKKTINQLSNMIFITIITQFFILIKNALVAASFGVSIELDAFYFTSNLSNFIYSFIGAGISTIIIPNLREASNKKAIDIFISFIYTLSLLLLILIFMFREPIIYFLSGSNNNFFIDIAKNILIYTLISGFLSSLISFVNGVLEYKERFNRQKLVILFTTILLVFLLWIGNNITIYYYVLLILIIAIINATVHFFLLVKSGYKYRLDFNIKDSGFQKLVKLFLPVALGQGVYQISLLIDTMIAARLQVGSITVLNYANALMSMINVLFLANITSYFYPRLIKKVNENDRKETLVQHILFLNAILCLIVVLFISVGKEGISILYERGDFTSQNTTLVYMCALIYVFSLPTNGIRDLIYKYFYIKNDTLTPFKNGVLISVMNILLSLIFSHFIGLYGVIVGTVLASYISLFFITRRLRKKYYSDKVSKNYFVAKEHFKIIIISFFTTVITIFIKNILDVENIYLSLIMYSGISLLIFIMLLFVTKSRIFKIKL